jgi:enterochelin esterase-like enzyme
MSWGVGLRNAIGLGLGGIATLFTGYGRDQEFNNLITESGANLVQEDGSFILV